MFKSCPHELKTLVKSASCFIVHGRFKAAAILYNMISWILLELSQYKSHVIGHVCLQNKWILADLCIS